MAPLISAIVPSYNYARFVVRAVESCLAQSFADLEVVVVDDASTDESPRLLAEKFGSDPRVRLELAKDNKGISGNFNRGLRAARGKYVGFCCADDEWLPGHAATLVPALEASGAVLAYAKARVVGADGQPVPPGPGHAFSGCPDELFYERLVTSPNLIPFVATVFDREAALAAGGFDERVRVLQDYALWLRLASRRPVRFVDVESVVVRWHGDNASGTGEKKSEQLKRDSVTVFEDLLARDGGLLRERGLEHVARRRLADALRRLASRTSGGEARSCARRVIGLQPFSPQSYLGYMRVLARGLFAS
jgi:GT2 family glycosyltransferase